jgi:hypothetical protein
MRRLEAFEIMQMMYDSDMSELRRRTKLLK